MKSTLTYVLLLVMPSFSCISLSAQHTDDSLEISKSYWEAGISYLSDNIYLGRKDSVRVPYITPSIGYYHKSGLFIDGSLSYLNSQGQSRIDLFLLEAGYTFSSKKLDGEISLSKDFYAAQSYSVKSEMKGSLDVSFDYDLGFIKPIVDAGLIFNNKPDYTLSIGAEHSFFAADDNFEITPSFLLNAGTQNYYNSYYTKRKYSPKRKIRNGNGGATVTAYLPNAAEFKIMDYELNLPIQYSVGNFIFNFSPTLAIPVNPTIVITTVTTATGNSRTKTSTEKLSNSFFWSVGVTYDF